MSDAQRVHQRVAGERVEADVIQLVDGLESIPDSDAHADAEATKAISPSDQMPFASICVVERDSPVEIKSAMVRATSQNSRGRFYIRQSQQNWLLDNRGVYLFVVADPSPQRRLLARKIVPAAIVDDLRNEWKKPDGRAAYDQLAWSRVFSPAEINRGESA